MTKALKFIGRYWFIPFLVLGVFLFWIFIRKRGTPIQQTKRELAAIEAGYKTEKLEATLGTERAKLFILANYTKEMNRLDEKQRKKADELRSDPVALAKYLVRFGT